MRFPTTPYFILKIKKKKWTYTKISRLNLTKVSFSSYRTNWIVPKKKDKNWNRQKWDVSNLDFKRYSFVNWTRTKYLLTFRKTGIQNRVFVSLQVNAVTLVFCPFNIYLVQIRSRNRFRVWWKMFLLLFYNELIQSNIYYHLILLYIFRYYVEINWITYLSFFILIFILDRLMNVEK